MMGSAFSEKYGGRAPEEIVRDTLYGFSQGMKVAVECVLMTADAGLSELARARVALLPCDKFDVEEGLEVFGPDGKIGACGRCGASWPINWPATPA